MNFIEIAVQRAVAKWRADRKIKRLGQTLDDPKTHEKLAVAIAERMRLEEPQ